MNDYYKGAPVAIGDTPGSPIGKVWISFSRFQAYVPTSGELYWTVQSELTNDSRETLGLSTNMDTNTGIGYTGPTRQFKDRPSYIEGLKYNKQEDPLYTDSNKEKEQSWRTFVRKTSPEFRYKGEPPQEMGEYPAGYEGTKYVYTYFPVDSSTENKQLQAIEQTQEGRVSGTLEQKTPFVDSMEFKIKFYVYKPTAVSTQEKDLPLAFHGVTGPFLSFEIGSGNNTYLLMFPYAQKPWMQYLYGDDYKVYAPDDSWILKNEKEIMDLIISDDKNIISIENSRGSNIWKFPDSTAEEKLAAGDPKITKISSGRNNTLDVDYLAGGIKIHHRGLKFGFNITPAEYAYPSNPSVEDIQSSPETVQQKALSSNMFISPPVLYSFEQDPFFLGAIGSPLTFPMIPFQVDKSGYNLSHENYGLTKSGVPVEDSVRYFLVDCDPNGGGFTKDSSGNILTGGNGLVKAYRCICFINPAKSVFDSTVSSSYFRPKVYGIRTVALVTFMPNPIFDTELSYYLQKISYKYTHEQYTIVRKTFDLEFHVPQPWNEDKHAVSSYIPRKGLNIISWEKIASNPAWIKISMFYKKGSKKGSLYEGSRNYPPNFTGMTQPGRITDKSENTTCNITAVDLFGILDKMPLFNSPFYDGMSIPFAIATLLERCGFKSRIINRDGSIGIPTGPDNAMFWVENPIVSLFTLPYSGVFTNPLVRPKNGEKALQWVKNICQRFYVSMYTDRTGRFVMTLIPSGGVLTESGLPATVYSDTNLVPATDWFYSMGKSTNNVMNMIYNQKVTDIPKKAWGNMFQVVVADKFTGKIQSVSRSNYASIFDPTQPDYLGYMNVYFQQKTALGGKQEGLNFLNDYVTTQSAPIRKVDITILGQDHLFPLQVIGVDNNKIRIESISGEMSRENNTWIVNISGFNMGRSWYSDVNPHIRD